MDKKKKYRHLTLDPRMTALVVIDMENDFCKAGGKLYHPDGVDEVIPHCQELLERCRTEGVRIVFVQSLRDKGSPEFVRFGTEPFIIRNTWGSAYIDELRPRPGEPIVEKETHDCFHRTEMDNLLARLNIRPETHTVIVMGVAADVCVYHAIIGFHVRHYNVVVPMDCCAGWPRGRRLLEAQMRLPAYNYNVTVTHSERIAFDETTGKEPAQKR
jgi:nicotinamidase-related amidase